MKKILLLICLVFIVTGCSHEYEINFGKKIDEKIVLNYNTNLYELSSQIDGDSLYVEKELVESDIPALVSSNGFYDKKLEVMDNKTKVTLKYSYDYENFEKSYLIDHCFEKKTFVNDDEYYYVSLGGSFDCYSASGFTLKVKSEYEVINQNADKYDKGYYIWNIATENSDNRVEFQVSKTLLKNKDSVFKLDLKIICWLLLFGVIVFLFIIKRKGSNDTE